MKNILIVANFCRDFSETDNGRFAYIANMLSDVCNVEIVTSSFYHGQKTQRKKIATELPYKVTMLYEPGYPKNVCLKRFFSHMVWGKNVAKYLEAKTEKPDVVYCAVPSLTGPKNAAKYCEKNGIKFIIDIQDLWPEAFRMAVDIPIISDIAFFPFKLLANGIYKRADYIFGVSQSYVDRALSVNHKAKGSKAVFIGTDLDTYDENVQNNKIADKPDGELWLGYCGTLGASYDLITVMDALSLLRDKGVYLPKFIVMGDGARKQEFSDYAKSKDLDVNFTGFLPYDKMCGMLNACDIVVNPIKGKSAASIINKHADYAACGRPVINTQESAEYRKLVDDYQMGFNCRNGDANDLAEKLEKLIESSSLRTEMGANARRCAEELFDRKHSYNFILREIGIMIENATVFYKVADIGK